MNIMTSSKIIVGLVIFTLILLLIFKPSIFYEKVEEDSPNKIYQEDKNETTSEQESNIIKEIITKSYEYVEGSSERVFIRGKFTGINYNINTFQHSPKHLLFKVKGVLNEMLTSDNIYIYVYDDKNSYNKNTKISGWFIKENIKYGNDDNTNYHFLYFLLCKYD